MTLEVVRLALVALLVAGCAASPEHASGPARSARPDVHGEPLALLPAGSLIWLRVQAGDLRASPHWSSAAGLVRSNGAEQLTALQHELGFDVMQTGQIVAAGLYVRPGLRAEDGARGLPLLYVRGGIDADAVVRDARAAARPDDPLVAQDEDGIRFEASHARVYVVAAPDVLFVFDPALTHRVLRVLSGEERQSVLTDDRFDLLWGQIGGRGGVIQTAIDAAALRRVISVPDAETSREINQIVMRADAPDAVDLRIAGTAASVEAADRVIQNMDQVRATLLGRFEVRLLGVTRLLNQGITDVREGTVIRVHVDAQADEVSRVLGALRLLH